MKLIKPVYVLAINAVACQLEVKCNGINVFEFKSKSSAKGNGIAITIPINHILLKNKEFSITTIVLPAHGKETLDTASFASITVSILDYVAPKETETKLLKMQTPKSTDRTKDGKQMPDIAGLKKYKLEGNAMAEGLPFEETGWANSIDLETLNPQQLHTEVYSFYQHIFSVISEKNTIAFIELTQERDAILEKVYYYGTHQIKLKNLQLEEIFSESGLTPIPFSKEDVKTEIMGEGKLVRLLRTNGSPAIVLYNPINRKTVKLDLKLHKKKTDSGLSII